MISRNAFTLLELVFVIIVLGILATIALPRFTATREDAEVAKARSTISAVRSGIINERQSRLFRGDNRYISSLDSGATTGAEKQTIFDNNGSVSNTILMYGIKTKDRNGYWLKTGTNEYSIKIGGETEAFDYNVTNGTFDCDHTHGLCQRLTE